MTEQEKKDFEWASGYYLYDDLDADWVNWDEEKLHDEIEKLAWQPFEHWEGEQIYNEIEKLADELENIWKSYSREVRNRVRARGAARARERGISVTNNNCRGSTLAEQRVQELIFENSDKIPEGLFIELMGSLVLR